MRLPFHESVRSSTPESPTIVPNDFVARHAGGGLATPSASIPSSARRKATISVRRSTLGVRGRRSPVASIVAKAMRALKEQKLSLDESRVLLKFYKHGLEGYTYLE